jgi:rare lipoprotein A (peptidoglycan hydrolase)
LRSLTKAMIILGMLSLVGFTVVTSEENIYKPVVNSNTEVNDEENNNNISLVDYIDKGVMRASWYGPRFHGKKTANGEIYDQTAFTAAHKKIKFGTLLKVTNPNNNKSVVVRINDRGPFIPGRQLDLSKAAALELDMMEKGVVNLKVEEIALKGINFPVFTLN